MQYEVSNNGAIEDWVFRTIMRLHYLSLGQVKFESAIMQRQKSCLEFMFIHIISASVYLDFTVHFRRGNIISWLSKSFTANTNIIYIELTIGVLQLILLFDHTRTCCKSTYNAGNMSLIYTRRSSQVFSAFITVANNQLFQTFHKFVVSWIKHHESLYGCQ